MNIYDITYEELECFFTEHSANKAKAKLVFNGIYKKRAVSFSEIKEFCAGTVNLLNSAFYFGEIALLDFHESTAGDAAKFLFGLSDKNTAEAVLMRHKYGNALCISTQVGCNMGCAFCESGRYKKIRDLTPGEMVMQILTAENAIGSSISHITLMGVGEPLDNFGNVKRFIDIIGNRHGLDIAKRHITVSTVGLIPELRQMAGNFSANLAVSLHAPNDELRSELIPVNRVYGINSLIETVREFSRQSNRKTAVEYVMLKDVNDSKENALELARLLSGVYCYVNLIPYNKTTSSHYECSDYETVSEFCRTLLGEGIRTTIRREFGAELKAACGQLRCAKQTGKEETGNVM